jgi:hypothetical protein
VDHQGVLDDAQPLTVTSWRGYVRIAIVGFLSVLATAAIDFAGLLAIVVLLLGLAFGGTCESTDVWNVAMLASIVSGLACILHAGHGALLRRRFPRLAVSVWIWTVVPASVGIWVCVQLAWQAMTFTPDCW